MLIKEVVQRYDGRVRYVDHNFGESELAKRFGVKKYPAVFVDEALVARPQDFHLWTKTESGRYTPWNEPASRERFKADLVRMIDRRLRGEEVESLSASDEDALDIESFPDVRLSDLSGRTISTEALAGRVVVVELWATWCPPCRSTLSWLRELEGRYGDALAVLAVAVQSQEEDVRELSDSGALPGHVVMGTEPVVQAFGNVLAVPTLYVFDASGSTASVFYGAPEELHHDVESVIDGLLQR